MPRLKRNIFNVAEVFRCAAEYTEFRIKRSGLLRAAPKGDGHPVLVLPGFTHPDALTKPLRNFLTDAGYKAYGWGGGINLGLQEKKCLQLRNQLKEIYEENGKQKVTIIGLSLGGIIARELAREFPEMVRDTISVHTPFGVGLHKKAVPAWLTTAIRVLSESKYSLKSEGMAERLMTPPPVPTTSIYSKTDGLAGWEACLNPKSPQAENVEVNGCHMAGFWNPKTITVILDRLAQPAGQWKPYEELMATSSKQPGTGWQDKIAGKRRFFPK
jgi:hypothetical protein